MSGLKKFHICIIWFAFAFAFASELAASPFTLNYSGRLARPNGRVLRNPVDIELQFFRSKDGNDPIAEVNSHIRPFVAVPLRDGGFSLELTLTGVDFQTVFNGTDDTWIGLVVKTEEVRVKGDPQGKKSITYPRQRYGIAPYALKIPVDGTSVKFGDDGRLTIGRIDAAKLENVIPVERLPETVSLLGQTIDSNEISSVSMTKLTGVLDPSTQLAASSLSLSHLAQNGCSVGAVMKYTSSGWVCGVDATFVDGQGNALLDANNNLVMTRIAQNSVDSNQLKTGIDPVKLGSGNVSSQEFGFLDGVTSSIQTQINTLNSTKGTVKTITAGAGLTGGSITSTGTISVDVGSVAGKIPQLDSNAAVAADGGLKMKDSDGTPNYVTLKPAAAMSNDVTYTLPAAPLAGRFLSTDAAGVLSWVISPLSAGAVGTTELANNAVTDAKVADVAATKITGQLAISSGGTGATTASAARTNLGLGALSTLSAVSTTEITDGTIANADISASAAIADSKLATISTAGKVADTALSSNIPRIAGDNAFDTSTLKIDSTNHRVGVGTTGPTSTLHVAGSFGIAAVTKTSNYTLTANDSFIAADANNAEIIITLPSAVGIGGRQYTIKKIDSSANRVILDASSNSQTVDLNPTARLRSQWETVFIVSNNTNWLVISSGVPQISPFENGEQSYTTAGSYDFVVPAYVTSISAVLVGGGGASSGTGSNYGGGGGGGGGLRWINSLAVTPGEHLTVNVGAGGTGDPNYTNDGGAGGQSEILRSVTKLVYAGGGGGGVHSAASGTSQANTGGAGGTGSTISGNIGGGNGGLGGLASYNVAGGAGGGAGGYSGAGGVGGHGSTSSTGTTAGAGGGGAGGSNSSAAGSGGGGGVGLLGEVGSGQIPPVGVGGYGGSAGAGGVSDGSGSGGTGGAYGGGGGADDDDTTRAGAAGGSGAVRIIWGHGRSFPSTLTGVVP